ncbi:MAG: tetratricopeptide repeat protein, partial [Deltaproteobacteria bacterium]
KYRFASPLINYAVYRRDQAMAGLLVEHGADINVKNNNGMSALGGAIKNGDIGMVKYLLGRGAQVEPFMVLLSEGKVSGQEKIDFPEITALIKPEVLRRQMLRAQAAVEAAQAPEDYQKAIAEYNLAKEMAPETPEIYYNLGLIEDKAGAYAEAIKDLQKYLQLSPSAGDAQAVKDMIYKLEYKRDQGRR